jgi:hypothetical protein
MGAQSRSIPNEALSSERPDHAEVVLVARGVATAVTPEDGLTDVQAALLWALTRALTGVEIDYHALEPLDADDLATALAARAEIDRQRIVHHMVLAELVLRPLPTVVAHRVAQYAQALGVTDNFVRIARRHAQGAHGLAWMDLRRSGFVEHVRQAADDTDPEPPAAQPFEPAAEDPELKARWAAFEDLPPGSLGRGIWDLYDSRGFLLPGSPGSASAYLAQHDFVHVLADYGTNVRGELEVFAFIGRADPDPKGFAWLATLIGLFETGYIADAGFFQRDVKHRIAPTSGMHVRLADALRRGRDVSERYGVDLFEVDYHPLAERPIPEVREMLRIPPKASSAVESGSPGAFDRAGMSELQRRIADEREAARR